MGRLGKLVLGTAGIGVLAWNAFRDDEGDGGWGRDEGPAPVPPGPTLGVVAEPATSSALGPGEVVQGELVEVK